MTMYYDDRIVCYALTENPVLGGIDLSAPEFFRRASAGPIWSAETFDTENNIES